MNQQSFPTPDIEKLSLEKAVEDSQGKRDSFVAVNWDDVKGNWEGNSFFLVFVAFGPPADYLGGKSEIAFSNKVNAGPEKTPKGKSKTGRAQQRINISTNRSEEAGARGTVSLPAQRQATMILRDKTITFSQADTQKQEQYRSKLAKHNMEVNMLDRALQFLASKQNQTDADRQKYQELSDQYLQLLTVKIDDPPASLVRELVQNGVEGTSVDSSVSVDLQQQESSVPCNAQVNICIPQTPESMSRDNQHGESEEEQARDEREDQEIR